MELQKCIIKLLDLKKNAGRPWGATRSNPVCCKHINFEDLFYHHYLTLETNPKQNNTKQEKQTKPLKRLVECFICEQHNRK